MIDVKKLVTGFLILAVATSASALLISTIGNHYGSSGNLAVAANNAPSATQGQTSTTLSGNAFLPQASDNQDSGDSLGSDTAMASATAAIMSDPSNLTNALANAYMNNLMVANPDGATVDGSGNETLTPPDATSVINQFISSSTDIQPPTIPDWDAEAAEIPIIITSSSPEQLADYGNALGGILSADIVQTNLQTVLNNDSDPSVIAPAAGDIQKALQDISGLKTPDKAADFQKNLIRTLVYAKNSLALAENAQTDPLKTELVLEAEDTKYQAALQNLEASIQSAQTQNLFSTNTSQPDQNKTFAILDMLTGTQVAHAQFAVIDAIVDSGVWATVAQMIKADVKDIVLQIVKNTIVFIMQKTIIAGIQGSGAPKFIQQWGATLANAFTQSAIGALNSQMSCVGAAPFAPQLRLVLGATYKPGNNTVCAVQFQSQLNNNLSSFYNNFSNGGWLTYGSTMQPDNDYYDSAFFVAQAVGQTAQNAQNAASAKAVAGQGFHGTAVCDDGSNPSGNTLQCQDPTGLITPTEASACPAGTTLIQTVPNNGYCGDGTEPQVQTPGAILNNMAASAINGNFELVTSANDWAGLASGLFVSILQEVLNSLAQTAIAGANGLLQQAANGGGANSVNGTTVTSPASSPQPITCYISADPSGNPLVADIMVSGGESIGATGITTPSYTWTPPVGGTLSATTGDFITATFNATGTYQVFVSEAPDNSNTTCSVTVPSSLP